jgi:hypothetical protein
MKKNNRFPGLPEEKINKLAEELSDPNLIPQPYVFNRTNELTDKVKEIVNELVAEYNRRVIKIIEKEKEIAFEAGRQDERRAHAKK